MTIGNILRELGDHVNADNFYKQMLKDKNLPDDTRGHLYFNMGMLADDRGAYLDALGYFQEAEKLIKTTPTQSSEVPASSRGLFAYDIAPSRMCVFNNLGRTYLKDGEYESAQKYFEDALREPGSKIERAIVLNNYGLLEFQRRNNKQAYDYIDQALQLARNDARSSEFKHNLDSILKHL
jgi:tetratricopeptide (TPR) repeat protein